MKTAKKIKILVVDDDPTVKKIWGFFPDERYNTTFATDGKSVLKLNLNNIDIILMDINMPELNGIEVTKILRKGEKHKQKIPIIAVTAHVDKNLINKCIEAGMNEVLNKPLLPPDLGNVINRWLKIIPSAPG